MLTFIRKAVETRTYVFWVKNTKHSHHDCLHTLSWRTTRGIVQSFDWLCVVSCNEPLVWWMFAFKYLKAFDGSSWGPWETSHSTNNTKVCICYGILGTDQASIKQEQIRDWHKRGWSVLGFRIQWGTLYNIFKAARPSVLPSQSITAPQFSQLLTKWHFWYMDILSDLNF